MDKIKNQCRKCGKAKRSKKKPLCTACYMDKSFPIWDGHTQDSIDELIEVLKIWVTTVMVIQKGYLSMFDLNALNNYHWEIFHREYTYDLLDANGQYQMMMKDIKKFIANYGNDPQ